LKRSPDGRKKWLSSPFSLSPLLFSPRSSVWSAHQSCRTTTSAGGEDLSILLIISCSLSPPPPPFSFPPFLLPQPIEIEGEVGSESSGLFSLPPLFFLFFSFFFFPSLSVVPARATKAVRRNNRTIRKSGFPSPSFSFFSFPPPPLTSDVNELTVGTRCRRNAISPPSFLSLLFLLCYAGSDQGVQEDRDARRRSGNRGKFFCPFPFPFFSFLSPPFPA